MSRPQQILKRAIDIVAGAILLVFLAPMMVVAALLVQLSSKGPILYRQERIGRNGSSFAMLKFRTMFVDQERLLRLSGIPVTESSRLLKLENDPRVTRIGRFLRRSSIDELPQLINVLRGEMSLVGPRPLLPFMAKPYPGLMRVRNRVRPGITGLWQVSARDRNTSALDMAEHDLRYVSELGEYGLWTDCKILVRTLPHVLRSVGAY